MIPIKLNHIVTIIDVNGRTQRGDELDPLLATISVQAAIPIEDLEVIFGADKFNMKAMKQVFWTGNGDRITESDHKMTIDYAVQGLRMEILVDAATEEAKKKSIFISNEARVMGFKLEFTLGFKVLVKFAAAAIVSEAQRDDGQMDRFFKYLNKPVTLIIEPLQADMLDDLDD